MRAIVCDRCGKVMLLPDDRLWTDEGYTLRGMKKELNLDLCEECAEELVKATREVKEQIS